MLRVDADELARLVASAAGVDRLGDAALVVVDGPAPPGIDLAGVPAVVVGVDVEVPDGGDLDALARTVHDHHAAAVALVLLLRGGARRSVAEGLVAESATYSMLQAGDDHRRWLADRGDRPARPAPPGPAVVVERHGDVVDVRLARPERRNAFSTAVRDGLLEALDVVAADPSACLRLRADGPSFSSGGDLDEFGSGPPPPDAHVVRLRRSVGRALAVVADRVEVEVHGACVGAGVELPAFAGRVVARAGATFRLPEVAMGLVPGAGGTVSIPRRIGAARAAWLALSGAEVDAATALAWGLVDDLA